MYFFFVIVIVFGFVLTLPLCSRRAWDAWSAMEHELGNLEQSEKLLRESFRIRFKAEGDFSVLANAVKDRFSHD